MYIFYSIPLILYGLSVIVSPRYYWEKYGIHMDFSDEKWVLGPFFIILGVYLFFKGRKESKTEIEALKKQTNLICSTCKNSYPLSNEKMVKCPKCDIELLTLEEFLKTINR